MPAPPREGESRKDFVARCASYMAENHPNRDRDEALAICYSMWEKHHIKKLKERGA